MLLSYILIYGSEAIVAEVGALGALKNMRDVAAVVRARRKELALTQTDLAKKLGTTQDRVSRLEQGSPRVEAAFVLDILSALDLGVTAEPHGDVSQVSEEDPFLGLYGNSGDQPS